MIRLPVYVFLPSAYKHPIFFQLPAIPRKGEHVLLWDETYYVTSVVHDLDNKMVKVHLSKEIAL